MTFSKTPKSKNPPPIVQNGTPVLRATAATVAQEEFGTIPLKNIIADMSAALATCDDGVALAAPQIGISKRIFVVSGRVLDEEAATPPPDLVFINPIIVKQSKTGKFVDEGCLSVRWLYGRVKRATKTTVEAYDVAGKKFTHHGTGLLAQIFQHEMDHLDGILFIDKAHNIQEIKPEDVIKD